MALFSSRSVDTIPGRGRVVPMSTGWDDGDSTSGGNANNLTVNAKARTRVLLEGVSASDGGEIAAGAHRVVQPIQNWLRLVFSLAGDDREFSELLPAELEVPVLIDRQSRAIVRIDEDAAAMDLQQYRAVGRKEFLETEAALAPVRAVFAMPRMAKRLAKNVVPEVKDLVKDIRAIGDTNTGPVEEVPMPAKELAKLRSTAINLGYMHQRDAKALGRARTSALQAGPMMASSVAARAQTVSSFEAWLMLQTLSHAITEEEAADFRRAAGLPRDETPAA